MQRRRAKRLGLGDPKSGTVTAIRRCGSDLNVNVHFHTLMPEGVFVEAGAAGGDARVPSTAATFGPAAPPRAGRAGRAGIADRGQYAIRDTFISHALTAGEDPAWVAELCGTSEQMIFRHYRGFLRGSLNGAEHGRRVSKHLSEGDQNHKPARETGTQNGTGADLARGGFGQSQGSPHGGFVLSVGETGTRTGTLAYQKDEKCRGNIEK